MKVILVLLMSLVSVNAFAGTQTVITPSNPIEACEETGSWVFINEIYDFEMVEDEKDLVITFSTRYFQSCTDGVPNDLDISTQYYFEFWREGTNWPWTPSPFYKAEYHLENSKVLRVELTFDKIKEFKDKTTRHIDFRFTPHHWQNDSLYFYWSIDIEKIDGLNSKISFD